jgi:hypothetical protein
MKMKTWSTRHSKGSPNRKVYSHECIYWKDRKIPNQWHNATSQTLEKHELAKPKTSRRREIIKIRSEINEIETNKKNTKINETKSWFFEKINKIDRPLVTWLKWEKKPKSVKSEMQMRANNKHHGNPGNHQRVLCEPIFQ